jgi:cytochrome c
MKKLIPVVAAAAAALALASAAEAAGDPGKGKATFNQQCSLCHSSEAGHEGAAPSLFGVVGRKAGSDAKFPAYTKALKSSGLTWTAAELDAFLSGPSKLVPGTAMPITLKNPADRDNVVAYLATLKH